MKKRIPEILPPFIPVIINSYEPEDLQDRVDTEIYLMLRKEYKATRLLYSTAVRTRDGDIKQRIHYSVFVMFEPTRWKRFMHFLKSL